MKITCKVAATKVANKKTKAGVDYTVSINRLSVAKTLNVDGIQKTVNHQFFLESGQPLAVGSTVTLDSANWNIVQRTSAPSAEYPKGGSFNWFQMKQEVILGAEAVTPVAATVVTEKGAA